MDTQAVIESADRLTALLEEQRRVLERIYELLDK